MKRLDKGILSYELKRRIFGKLWEKLDSGADPLLDAITFYWDGCK